jgi:hypothetical protein
MNRVKTTSGTSLKTASSRFPWKFTKEEADGKRVPSGFFSGNARENGICGNFPRLVASLHYPGLLRIASETANLGVDVVRSASRLRTRREFSGQTEGVKLL